MTRRTRALVVVLVVLAVLVPTWAVALQGEPPSEEVEIDHGVSEIRPLDGFVDAPNKLSPSQVGVIVWVALFGLLGALAFFHRFMDRLARPPADAPERVADGGEANEVSRPSSERSSDGGERSAGSRASSERSSEGGEPSDASRVPSELRSDGGVTALPWLETGDRWIVAYREASEAREGLIAMGGLTVLTIAFAALFTGEYLTLARTQYFGVYAFGMFTSLAGLTVSYYAWFMPHVEVAERRDHS
ncbi:hypothetical protein [Halomicrobium salinisoli]|uniref:hypothetical protein n=1 Tax=Halomicrobium salinisoli TaxID=2878391 RepID=UPI001CF02A43|nr:hypothetical protein [Halomicrobium salinisoli]